MKHLLRIVLIAIMASACQEYTSHYPIGKPTESTIKSPLLGDWVFVSSINLSKEEVVDYGSHFLRITPFNEKEFLIQLISDSLKSMNDVNQFRGFISIIQKQNFANISPVNNEGKRPVFSIYQYQLKGDSLLFQGISQETFESLNTYVNSTGQHKRFIKSSLNNLRMWDMEYTYIRK